MVDATAAGAAQVIKLAESAAGSSSLIPASASTGLLVNVSAVAGNVAVVNPSGQKLAVDASGITLTVGGTVAISGNPAVAQSGTWNIGTVATITNPVTVTGTVAISGTVPATQSGTWNIGTVATITNPVTVTGTVAISGTPTVQGTVTVTQGTAAAVAGAWPLKLTDGTNSATLQNVGGTYCLPVKVLAQAGGGYSQQDKTAFTEGTTYVEVIGGVYNDAFSSGPSAGQVSVTRITANRALHVNLRNAAGTEIGTSSNPVAVAPSGATLPVSGSVTAVPSTADVTTGQTAWRAHVVVSAGQTSIAIRTPTSGKKTYVEGIIITLSGGSGLLYIYDGTSSASTRLWASTVTWANQTDRITPARPIPLAAINNILRYDSGASVVGDIVAWGYEA